MSARVCQPKFLCKPKMNKRRDFNSWPWAFNHLCPGRRRKLCGRFFPIRGVDAPTVRGRRAGWESGRDFEPAILLPSDLRNFIGHFRQILVLAHHQGDIVRPRVPPVDNRCCLPSCSQFFQKKHKNLFPVSAGWFARGVAVFVALVFRGLSRRLICPAGRLIRLRAATQRRRCSFL